MYYAKIEASKKHIFCLSWIKYFIPHLYPFLKFNFKIVRHGTQHMMSFVAKEKGEKQ